MTLLAPQDGGAPAKPAVPAPADPVKVAKGGDAPAKKPAADDDEKAPALTKEQLEARSLAGRAVEAFQKKDYAKAGEMAQAARQLDARYPLPLKVIGWVAFATDDKRTTELLTDALNADPKDGDLQFLLAKAHLRVKEWGAAKDLLADLVKKQGATAPLLLEIANACAGEEDWAGAEASLLEARKIAPKDREIADALVDVYEKSDQPEKAILELQTLVKIFPTEGGLRYHQAHLLINLQKFEDAASVLEEAARVLPEDPMPHKMLEQLYEGPYPDPVRLEAEKNWLKEYNLRRR
jgi:predicted Zn-dependent protease